MALQTLLEHYFGQLQRRMTHAYEGGQVIVSVPEVPGVEAYGNSEREAENNYVVKYLAWMVHQLESGYPVPPIGGHEINSDHNRDIFMQETGITIPYLTEQPAPDQTWFWTPEWQAKEREADEDIATGRVERFNSDEEFLAAFPD
jgi:predicted RNase H-like HicB family nuclease